MSSTATTTQSVITLKGSTAIVTEFFGYSINSILFQRGIYPPETFQHVKKYGLGMLVTSDSGLRAYLSQVLQQLSSWLMAGHVQRLVLVIEGVETKAPLERWVFNIQQDQTVTEDGPGKVKSTKDIQNEIQAVLRQITASVTFLPILQEPCTFDLLVYTDTDADVPQTWENSDPKFISDSTEVRLRSFTTKVHKVDAMVAYKSVDDDDV